MKNLGKFIFLALVCLPFIGHAQNPELDNFFNKYHGHEDVSSILISMDAIKISMAEDEDDHMAELMEQVDKVKILNFKNRYKTFDGADFVEEVQNLINEDYKLLIDVIDEKEKVKIYVVNGADHMIKEGLIMVQENEEASLIWVTGNIKLADFMHSHKSIRFIQKCR